MSFLYNFKLHVGSIVAKGPMRMSSIRHHVPFNIDLYSGSPNRSSRGRGMVINRNVYQTIRIIHYCEWMESLGIVRDDYIILFVCCVYKGMRGLCYCFLFL